MAHGLVLGKFMPPHLGHLHLIEFARSFTSDLSVVVGSLAHESIPGQLRWSWMNELCPFAKVLHLTDENPQSPDQHPDFWSIWKTSLDRLLGRPLDYVFASEAYGAPLAEVMGAHFIPTNAHRELVPISGSAIRQDPWMHWELLPPSVRAYYGKRVLIFGPESTGKSTLAKALAERFTGTYLPEYARTYLQGRESHFGLSDMLLIARGQQASEKALAATRRPLLFCDTDPLTTQLWCRELFGEVPPELPSLIAGDHYDLILLMDADVPWVAGALRLRPDARQSFLANCRSALEEQGRVYHLISGDWDKRFQRAVDLVNELVARRPDPKNGHGDEAFSSTVLNLGP